jgi:type IV pilus assembly protein PilA
MNKGFTLIEILVVIGILAILAGIVIVAINPAKQFAQGRNTQRESNVNTILDAIGQRLVDNAGNFPEAAGCGSVTEASAVIGSGAGQVDLSCLVPTYISTALPVDPSLSGAHWASAEDYDTEYTVSRNDIGRFKVCAPGHEEAAIPDSSEYCLER